MDSHRSDCEVRSDSRLLTLMLTLMLLTLMRTLMRTLNVRHEQVVNVNDIVFV
jgi:hypothetical protein